MGGVIDNGNHLVLSGNRAVQDYLARIGAKNALTGPPHAEFSFVDLRDGARWMLRPNEGPLPYWMASGEAPRAGQQGRATICTMRR